MHADIRRFLSVFICVHLRLRSFLWFPKQKLGDKAAATALATLRRVEEGLNRGQWALELCLSPQEKEKLQATPLHLETLPVRGYHKLR